MFWPTQLLLFLLFIGETSVPNWDNEEEVTSQLILLGLLGIDTLDEFVSKRVKEILKSCHVEENAKISIETSIKLMDFNSNACFVFSFRLKVQNVLWKENWVKRHLRVSKTGRHIN